MPPSPRNSPGLFSAEMFRFRVEEWTGTLNRDPDETVDAKLFFEDEQDEPHPSHERLKEAFEDLRRFTGQVILK